MSELWLFLGASSIFVFACSSVWQTFIVAGNVKVNRAYLEKQNKAQEQWMQHYETHKADAAMVDKNFNRMDGIITDIANNWSQNLRDHIARPHKTILTSDEIKPEVMS